VLRLISAFVDVMLHRTGPDSLPSSSFLLWAVITLAIVADCIVLWLAGSSGRGYVVAVLVTGFNIWFVWALLRTFNRQGRFRQTVTAILGAGVLLTGLQAPLVLALPEAVQPDSQPATLTLPDLLWFFIRVWWIDINAFVFSRALERPYFLCVAIVIGYVLLIQALQVTLLQPLP
jgi:hypothetical protein